MRVYVLVLSVMQPLALEMQTVIVTQPVQRVTSVTVVQTMNVRTTASETAQVAPTETGQAPSGIMPAPLAEGTAAQRILPTAPRRRLSS